jgi:transcriptional regulator with XRE-family HTH domain
MDKSQAVNKVIRDRLRQAREDSGLSQEEAAGQLHKPQWFVSRSETGGRRVDVGELVEFGKVYGKPISYFLDELQD